MAPTLSDMLSLTDRRFVIAGPVVAGALLLAACGGGSDSGASATTLDLSQSSTAFVVRPPVTTIAADLTVPSVATGSQEYTVQAGDYPLKVAAQFGVTLADLIAINEWASEKEFPFPGTVIQIPPGGTIAPSTTVAAGTTGDGTASTTPAETIPDAGDNCAEGEYEIVDGDFEGKVATKFDVTVDALRAANANTSGYSSFYPGLKIVIPGKADC